MNEETSTVSPNSWGDTPYVREQIIRNLIPHYATDTKSLLEAAAKIEEFIFRAT